MPTEEEYMEGPVRIVFRHYSAFRGVASSNGDDPLK